MGAAAQGILFSDPLFSKLFMTRGIITMPGIAMPTLLITTMVIPCRAAIFDLPIVSPASVSSMIPSDNSVRRISGMLMMFPTATAAKGTSRPTSGGSVFTTALRPRAVARALPVAAT
jgi:hypothetical protein